MTRRAAAAAVLALAAGGAAAGGPGSALPSRGLCAAAHEVSAVQQDRRLRLVARIRHELEAAGRPVALVARSGLDLERFGLRYSHAGFALRDSPNTRWSVRQLYYACDEARPRLFDQGLAGFLLAADALPEAHVTLLLPPPEAAAALAATALDPARALPLLATRYSANAHAFATRYQNCNQWAAELMAAAWGELGPAPTRADAQQWLRRQDYRPHRFGGSPWLYALAGFVPLIHHDDHPEEDRLASVFQVSMPASLEELVLRLWPASARIELCHDERQIVVRRGGPPLGPGCEAAPGDERMPFGADGQTPTH